MFKFLMIGSLLMSFQVSAQESYIEHPNGVKDYAYTVYTQEFAEKHNLPEENVVELSEGLQLIEFQLIEREDAKLPLCFFNILINQRDDFSDFPPTWAGEPHKKRMHQFFTERKNLRLFEDVFKERIPKFWHGRISTIFMSSNYDHDRDKGGVDRFQVHIM